MPSYKDEKTGKWYCSFRYTDIRGKRVQKMKRGFMLKRDADKWEREFLAKDHPEEIAVGRLLSDYLVEQVQKYNVGNIKYSSLIAAQNCVRLYVEPYWKSVVASKVTPMHVSEWLVKITTIEPKEKGPRARSTKTRRSSSTVNRAKAILREAFCIGRLNYGLQRNPVEEVKNLKKFSNDHRAKLWTVEQYKVFRASLQRADMMVLFDIQFYGGLRIGEALALTPGDVTPYRLLVTKTVFYPKYNEMVVSSPKSESSKRAVEIPRFLYDEIQAYIKSVHGLKTDTMIFDIKTTTARQHLVRHAELCNLPAISPHILRHSYASHMLTLTDTAAVSKQLGHSNPAITQSIYSHMIPGSDRSGVDAFEKLLENKK